jgi:hypothetical protein
LASIYPGELVPWIPLQFFDNTGAVLALGTLETYSAGTSTPLATYTDANLTVANPTTITLTSAGRAPNPIFLKPQGYKFITKDSNGAVIQTIDLIENTGQVGLVTLGNVLASGARSVTSGYVLLSSDYLVTVASTGATPPCVINLPAASSVAAQSPKVIKNAGTVAIALTPAGADVLDLVNAAYTIPAAASPSFPSLIVYSDGISSWFIAGSHKCP